MKATRPKLKNTEGYGCILRVACDDADMDDLLSRVKITPYRIDRKGQPWAGGRPLHDRNGFHVLTHQATQTDLQLQIDESIAFFRTHAEDLACILSFPGVTSAELDIGIVRRDVIVQNEYLPAELLALAGSLGIGINISLYPGCESDTEPVAQS